MALDIILGGTTGLTDGSLEIPDDGIGLQFSALNSPSAFHLRARTSGKSNSQEVVVGPLAGYSFSKDNIAYGASVSYSAGEIPSTNTPCYIKQTAYGAEPGLVISPRAEYVSIADLTVPTWPGGNANLTVSASGVSLVLDCVDATDNFGVTEYSWERSNDGLSGWAEVGTSAISTYTDAIGSAPVTRYYRVRAKDEASNWSAYSSVASGTTTAYFSDNFEDNNIDTALIRVEGTAAYVNETGGQLVLNTTGDVTRTAGLFLKKPLLTNTVGSFTVAVSIANNDNVQQTVTMLNNDSYTLADNLWTAQSIQINHQLSTFRHIVVAYWHTDGARRYWDTSSSGWVTTGQTNPFAGSLTAGDSITAKIEINGSSQFRVILLRNGGGTTTTSWVALSDVRGTISNNWWFAAYDQSASVEYHNIIDSITYAAS